MSSTSSSSSASPSPPLTVTRLNSTPNREESLSGPLAPPPSSQPLDRIDSSHPGSSGGPGNPAPPAPTLTAPGKISAKETTEVSGKTKKILQTIAAIAVVAVVCGVVAANPLVGVCLFAAGAMGVGLGGAVNTLRDKSGGNNPNHPHLHAPFAGGLGGYNPQHITLNDEAEENNARLLQGK